MSTATVLFRTTLTRTITLDRLLILLGSNHLQYINQLICVLAHFTLFVLLSIIGKRFQDAGLKSLYIKSGVVAEGSVSALLEGGGYNRAIRVCKLAYETMIRVSWGLDMDHIKRALDEIANLANDLKKENQPFEHLKHSNKRFEDHLRKTK